ncbi:MAG: glutathione peroxidase [Gammaproteobacteria bacterium]|nr:glutathione peroxidase [Gammaproteobacteria bacterium]
MTRIYDHAVKTIEGTETTLDTYRGKVLLIVNTASQCGFTPQYKGLEDLYEKYKSQGFEILGFPCNQFKNQEPAGDSDISQFCELNYGVTFPLFSKIDVNGPHSHPLFQTLKQAAPGFLGSRNVKWNFTKFLVNRDGEVVKRFAPMTKPEKIESSIQALL